MKKNELICNSVKVAVFNCSENFLDLLQKSFILWNEIQQDACIWMKFRWMNDFFLQKTWKAFDMMRLSEK